MLLLNHCIILPKWYKCIHLCSSICHLQRQTGVGVEKRHEKLAQYVRASHHHSLQEGIELHEELIMSVGRMVKHV